jgi:DNA-cytosine methyltransferase
MLKTKPFRVFSTFTGIGGFEIGIENAANGRPVEFVGYSEIDKYAVSVYEHHFKGVRNYGDITKIDEKTLPDFDCLVGGFPCQAFSVAGKRAGFADTRGTLFFDLARILRTKRPGLFVFENVKGLLNHDNGNTFRTIITTIIELGYECQWQVVNSKDYGVPQNRERVIIVGHLRGTSRPQIFPITGENGKTTNVGELTERGAQKFIKTRHLSQNGRLVSDSTTLQASEIPHIIQSPRGKNAGNAHEIAPTLTGKSYQDNNHVVLPTVEVGTLRTHKDGEGFRPTKSGLAPTIPARARNDGSGQPVVKILTGSPKYVDGKRTMAYKVSDEAPTIRATQHKSGDNQPKVLIREATKRAMPRQPLAKP